MANSKHGVGGLTYDTSKRHWPNEANVFIALIILILIFEGLGLLTQVKAFCSIRKIDSTVFLMSNG